jgi:rare lipoprotein A
MGDKSMQRWLIILSLAMVQYPDIAAASTRSAEIPLWKRLLSVLTPKPTSATSQVHRESVRRDPVHHDPVHHEPVHHEPVHHEHAQPTKMATPPSSAQRIAAPAVTKGPDLAPPVVVAAPITAQAAPAPAVIAPPIAAASPPAAPPAAEPAVGSLARPTPAEPPQRARSTKVPVPLNSPERVAAPPLPAAPSSIVEASPVAPVPTSPPPPIPETVVGSLPRPGATEPTRGREPRTKISTCNTGQRIISAYYWEGRHTASGQPFNPRAMTAAHRTLPFGTQLTVTNPRNGQSVTVVINDRGPYVSGVSLDLSLGAAQAIGLHGTGSVCIL